MRCQIVLLLVVLGAIETSYAFSIFRVHSLGSNLHVASMRDDKFGSDMEEVTLNDRRELMKKIFSGAISSATILSSSKSSNAACLPGDVSPDCIGVYKLPLDDAVSSYIDTPEHLAKNAPDLRWVPMPEYPKSYKVAKEELTALHSNLNGVNGMILKGDFTGAGIELLAMAPRVTLTGRTIIQTLQSNNEFSMKAMRVENAHIELMAALGSCDIVIGQALNGRLGSTTMAQIQILEDIRDADQGFKELLGALPDGFEG